MPHGTSPIRIELWLQRMERIGWAFLRALIPFALALLTIRLVADPASLTLYTGVGSLVATAVGRGSRTK